jgi:hypothetical protein
MIIYGPNYSECIQWINADLIEKSLLDVYFVLVVIEGLVYIYIYTYIYSYKSHMA